MASQAAVKILRAFLEEPDQEQYGFGIMRSTGLKSASVYPMLDRLEQSGWILGYDEDIDERTAGRRRRRLYKLSPTGERRCRGLQLVWMRHHVVHQAAFLERAENIGTQNRAGFAAHGADATKARR